MKTSKFWLLIFVSAILLTSCSDDESGTQINLPEGDYVDGFFVTNEGQFPGPGSITFVSSDLDSVYQHIYEGVNGQVPGSVVQSMFFDDQGRAYIVANNSNKITVVDRYTFEKLGVIDQGLEMPRYGVVEDGKAYVTNQGSNPYVAIIDLQNLSVTGTIDMNGQTVEYIEDGDNGMLYVQNAAFGTGNLISVIDPVAKIIVDTIQTAQGLSDIEVEDQHVYALTATALQIFDLSGNTTNSVSLNYSATPGKLAVDDNQVYFTVDKSVYAMASSATSAPASPLLTYNTQATWGAMYGFAVENGQIYIADAGDFTSDSFIEVYKVDGTHLQTIEVGVSPNGFYFND